MKFFLAFFAVFVPAIYATDIEGEMYKHQCYYGNRLVPLASLKENCKEACEEAGFSNEPDFRNNTDLDVDYYYIYSVYECYNGKIKVPIVSTLHNRAQACAKAGLDYWTNPRRQRSKNIKNMYQHFCHNGEFMVLITSAFQDKVQACKNISLAGQYIEIEEATPDTTADNKKTEPQEIKPQETDTSEDLMQKILEQLQ